MMEGERIEIKKCNKERLFVKILFLNRLLIGLVNFTCSAFLLFLTQYALLYPFNTGEWVLY